MVEHPIVSILPTLPSEIHNEIFQHLSFHEHWQLAHTCQSWRFIVLKWQPQWKTLPINERCSIVPDMTLYGSFIENTSVKQIRVHYLDHASLSDIVGFIQKHQFRSISKVDLAVSELSKELFQTLVNTCGDALTDIKITGLGNFMDNVGPDALLKLCPKLIKLDFNGCVFAEQARYDPKYLVNLKHESLLALSLRFHNMGEFRSFDPYPYLKTVPKLRYLSLNIAHLQVRGEQLAEMIRNCCPELETLVIFENVRNGEKIPEIHKVIMDQNNIINGENTAIAASGFSSPLNPLPLSSTKSQNEETPTKKQRGLQHIVIHQHNFAQTARRTCQPLLEIFHNELVTLDLAGVGTINNDILGRLSMLSFPSLEHLKLRNNDFARFDLDSFIMTAIFQAWDASNQNNLTHLDLSNLNISVNDALLTMIGVTCRSLQDITLNNTYGLTDDGMLTFLDQQQERYHHQKTVGGKNYLHGITLDSARQAMNSGVLTFMGREMGYLERIKLRSASFDYDGYDHMQKFVGVRKYCLEQQGKDTNNRIFIKQLENLEISFHQFVGYNPDQFGEDLEIRFQNSMNSIAKRWSFMVERNDEEGQVPGAVTTVRKITNVEFK